MEATKTLLIYVGFSVEITDANVAKMVEKILDAKEGKAQFIAACLIRSKLPNFVKVFAGGKEFI